MNFVSKIKEILKMDVKKPVLIFIFSVGILIPLMAIFVGPPFYEKGILLFALLVTIVVLCIDVYVAKKYEKISLLSGGPSRRVHFVNKSLKFLVIASAIPFFIQPSLFDLFSFGVAIVYAVGLIFRVIEFSKKPTGFED